MTTGQGPEIEEEKGERRREWLLRRHLWFFVHWLVFSSLFLFFLSFYLGISEPRSGWEDEAAGRRRVEKWCTDFGGSFFFFFFFFFFLSHPCPRAQSRHCGFQVPDCHGTLQWDLPYPWKPQRCKACFRNLVVNEQSQQVKNLIRHCTVSGKNPRPKGKLLIPSTPE